MSTLLKPIVLFFRFLLYLFIAWALGFALFIIRLPAPVSPDNLKADAIVVLTGGKGRLEAGIALLKNGTAKRLLISGVHPDVLERELSTLTGTAPALFDCCIDLDYVAGNTLGNASETAAWVKKNQYDSLILVTADYHIQRSDLLFRQAMPHKQVIRYPVSVDVGVIMLAREYSKYLATLLQHALEPTKSSERQQGQLS